jgi:hypothetical protein
MLITRSNVLFAEVLNLQHTTNGSAQEETWITRDVAGNVRQFGGYDAAPLPR